MNTAKEQADVIWLKLINTLDTVTSKNGTKREREQIFLALLLGAELTCDCLGKSVVSNILKNKWQKHGKEVI